MWSLIAQNPHAPLLFRGAASHWPCVAADHPSSWQPLSRWTSLADRPVSLEAGPYTSSGFDFKQTSLSDFVQYLIASEQAPPPEAASSAAAQAETLTAAGSDAGSGSGSGSGSSAEHEHREQPERHENSAPPLYLAQQEVEAVFPELCGDFALPFGLDRGHVTQHLVWVGPSTVVTPLHRDPAANFFCHIRGLKRFVLVDASRRDARVAPSPLPHRRNTSTLDLTWPVLEIEKQSPGFCELPRFAGVLAPGDILYIPRDMWHFVEGVGDHACEYMTGGRVIVLGPTGVNFAAGMSGGIAYVFDPYNEFEPKCNTGMVTLESIDDRESIAELLRMIELHHKYTQSTVADEILDNWETNLELFIKVMPLDYKRVITERRERNEEIDSVFETHDRKSDRPGV